MDKVFLSVFHDSGASHSSFYVINFYSSCTIVKKMAFWNDLQYKETLRGDVWCVMGDLTQFYLDEKEYE